MVEAVRVKLAAVAAAVAAVMGEAEWVGERVEVARAEAAATAVVARAAAAKAEARAGLARSGSR